MEYPIFLAMQYGTVDNNISLLVGQVVGFSVQQTVICQDLLDGLPFKDIHGLRT